MFWLRVVEFMCVDGIERDLLDYPQHMHRMLGTCPYLERLLIMQGIYFADEIEMYKETQNVR